MPEDLPNIPPTVDPLDVRCPVPYCRSAPHYKCITPKGFYLASAHRQRHKAARLAMAPAKEGRDGAR